MAIKFDVSNLPADATITGAELSLYAYEKIYSSYNGTLNNRSKSLYKITSTWDEGTIRWSNKPTNASSATATAGSSAISVWEDFDVTSLISDVVENSEANYGFLIKFTTNDYGVRFRSSDYTADETLRPKFTSVYEDNTAPKVTVLSPGTADVFNPDDDTEITWDATDTRDVVSRRISFSSDNGATWSVVDEAQGNTGTYDWTVPNEISTTCLIKIEATDAGGNVGSDESGVFIIEPASSIKYKLYGINIVTGEKLNVKITNIQGREIASFETKNLRHINKMMKLLSSGVHIIHITTPNQKFSKQIRVVR